MNPLKERNNKPSSLSLKTPGVTKVKALPGSVNVKHAKSQITFNVQSIINQLYSDMLFNRNDCSYKTEKKLDETLRILRVLQKSNEREKEDIMYSQQQMQHEFIHNCQLEHLKAVEELKKKIKLETEQEIENAKRKQWCANCWEEANLRCCWNTSYCNTKCQSEHWEKGHKKTCSQHREDGGNRKL